MVDVKNKSAVRAPVVGGGNASTQAAPGKKAAPATPTAPARWGAPAADAKPVTDGFQSPRTSGAKPAAPQPRILSNEQQVDLRDPASRREIAIQATQVNEVSLNAGNADDICGGAALASALVLASATPEAAQANATAMRNLINARVVSARQLPSGVNPAAIEAALGHLEKGTLSRTDLFHLQQGLYACARTYAHTGDDKPGVNVGQMASIVAELTGRGATIGSTSMVEVELTPASKDSDASSHWVANASDGLINTGGSTVPREWLSPKSSRFSGDVRVGADVKFRTTTVMSSDGSRVRPGSSKGWTGALTPMDPNNIKQALAVGSIDQQLMKAAATFNPTRPGKLE